MKTVRFSADGTVASERAAAWFYYDLLGRRTVSYFGDSSRTYPEGGQAYAWQEYKYDADGDLKQLNTRWANVAHTGASALLYRYDQDGSGKITKAFTPIRYAGAPPAKRRDLVALASLCYAQFGNRDKEIMSTSCANDNMRVWLARRKNLPPVHADGGVSGQAW